MKIRTALIILVVIILISVAGGAVVSVRLVGEITTATDYQLLAERVVQRVWKLQARSYSLYDTSSLRSQYEQWLTTVQEYKTSHETLLGEAEGITTMTPEVRERLATLEDFYDRVVAQIDVIQSRFEQARQAGMPLVAGGGLFELMQRADVPVAVYTLDQELENLIVFLDGSEANLISQLVNLHQSSIERFHRASITTFLTVAAGVFVLSALYVLLFARYLSRRLERLRGVFNSLTEGDLTVNINVRGRDEVAQISRDLSGYILELAGIVRAVKESIAKSEQLKESLSNTGEESSASVQEMTANIRSIGKQITQLNEHVETTSSSVSDIYSRVSELSSRIEHQSSSVTQSSSAVEEMAASIENVARITTQRTETSDQLVEVTRTGNQKVQATNDVVQEIARSVENIMEIIGIINKIAGQTSILSMNAAIEAAHAGEYGRGFSVVAGEIRSLSDSTNENARKIREALEDITSKALQAQQLGNDSSDSFNAIMEEVGRFTSSLQEISATTDELSSGTQQMLQSMSDLSNTTQDIRTTAESISSGTQSIDTSMQEIRSISGQVENGMQEINAGTEEINRGMTHLTELSRQSSRQIDELSATIARFKIRDDGT